MKSLLSVSDGNFLDVLITHAYVCSIGFLGHYQHCLQHVIPSLLSLLQTAALFGIQLVMYSCMQAAVQRTPSPKISLPSTS